MIVPPNGGVCFEKMCREEKIAFKMLVGGSACWSQGSERGLLLCVFKAMVNDVYSSWPCLSGS